jgi:transcriptional regulator with XRE-family HTH domain
MARASIKLDEEQRRVLAANVRGKRARLGVSLERLARKADLSLITVWSIETARRGAYLPATLRKLARGLKCPVAELFEQHEDINLEAKARQAS